VDRVLGLLPAGLLAWLEDPRLLKGVQVAAAAVGFLGIHCSAMIYVDTPREWWASKDTLWKFYLTAGSLGPALVALGGARVPAFFLLAVAAGFTKGFVESRVLKHRQTAVLTAMRKTALLLSGPFKSLFQTRAALGLSSLALVGGGIFLDSFLLVFAGAALRLAGELMERHLFFVAVVPPKMPGTI
jgi:formate dehydrogenase iron-sulfur subunit